MVEGGKWWERGWAGWGDVCAWPQVRESDEDQAVGARGARGARGPRFLRLASSGDSLACGIEKAVGWTPWRDTWRGETRVTADRNSSLFALTSTVVTSARPRTDDYYRARPRTGD